MKYDLSFFQEMTVLTSLDITIENPDLEDKKITRDEDGMPIRPQVSGILPEVVI